MPQVFEESVRRRLDVSVQESRALSEEARRAFEEQLGRSRADTLDGLRKNRAAVRDLEGEGEGGRDWQTDRQTDR